MYFDEFRKWRFYLKRWSEDPKKRKANRPQTPDEILKMFQMWEITSGR